MRVADDLEFLLEDFGGVAVVTFMPLAASVLDVLAVLLLTAVQPRARRRRPALSRASCVGLSSASKASG
jgi:hypothetical protein